MNMITVKYQNKAPITPHCKAHHASLQVPTKFKLSMENMLAVPRSAIFDGAIAYGGATGIGAHLPRKAFGEYIERNHLFTNVPMTSTAPLTAIKPINYREKLRTLCHPSVDDKALDNHHFAWTQVQQIYTDEPQKYFYNTISLNGRREDTPYIYFTDSCACAVHPKKDKALYYSMMEFIERQAMVGSWLSKTHQYAINPEVLLAVTPYHRLVEQLLSNGRLYVIENGCHLPGHTVVIYYFSDCADDVVQYSIGSSTGLSLQEALTSALVELYQCYAFLYNMEVSSGLEQKAGSGYHVSFQACNTQETFKRIPFIQSTQSFVVDTVNDVNNLVKYSWESLMTELKKMSQDVYYYHYFEPNYNMHITKVMSPDFFAHMSLNQSLNFENQYAKQMKIDQQSAYLEKIPFP